MHKQTEILGNNGDPIPRIERYFVIYNGTELIKKKVTAITTKGEKTKKLNYRLKRVTIITKNTNHKKRKKTKH